MRRVPCEYLRPGMVLAGHVYHFDGRVLLARGVTLTQPYINGLIQKGVASVYIEDEISEDIYISDVVLEETRRQAVKHIRHTINNVYSKLHNGDSHNLEKLKSSIKEITEQLLNNKNLVYDLIDIRAVGDYLFGHSVNVCILATMTGISLQLGRSQLEQLAVGAVFHDIGKALLPPNILNKPGRLNDEEFEEVKKHPEYSLDILRKNIRIDSVSRVIAYQHHEKYNGDGYPLGRSGKDILDMSQIVGMVDIYDAVTSDRCYSKAMPPNEAYEMISGSGDHYFKYTIVRAFLSQIAAYPSGALVQLSSGEVAIVAKNFRNRPLAPRVRILTDPGGIIQKPFIEKDLFIERNLVIKRVLSEAEVQKVLLQIKNSLG